MQDTSASDIDIFGVVLGLRLVVPLAYISTLRNWTNLYGFKAAVSCSTTA